MIVNVIESQFAITDGELHKAGAPGAPAGCLCAAPGPARPQLPVGVR